MADDLWSQELIATTIDELGLSAGVDAELPDYVRFVRRVRELVTSYTSKHGRLAGPALFVLAPSIEDDLKARATLRRRIHTGEVDPALTVWMVGSAVADAFAIALENNATDDAFALVCEDLGLGDAPAVFCDAAPDPQIFAWYPLGLAQADRLYEGPIVLATPPNLDDLMTVVDRVHQTRLMTTHNQNLDTSLWQDRSKYWAHKRAEKRVQDALMAGLGGAFGRPYFVVQEVSSDSGRFDIGFREATAPGTTALRAVLELKVARSFGSTGSAKSLAENEQHAVDGVEQAWSYADDHGADESACLVFDLRADEHHQAPEAATAKALELGVLLRLWRCFPTAEDYRTFKVAGQAS